jgi:hypothetical protein
MPVVGGRQTSLILIGVGGRNTRLILPGVGGRQTSLILIGVEAGRHHARGGRQAYIIDPDRSRRQSVILIL